MNDQRTAFAIYQNLLDRIDDSLAQADFHKYLSCVCIPHALITTDVLFSINTKKEFAIIFKKTRQNLKLKNISGLTRHCLGAHFENENTIVAKHETRLITDKLIIQESFVAVSTLIQVEGNWRIQQTQYNCSSISLPVDLSDLERSRLLETS
jgi:hypothetical protein